MLDLTAHIAGWELHLVVSTVDTADSKTKPIELNCELECT